MIAHAWWTKHPAYCCPSAKGQRAWRCKPGGVPGNMSAVQHRCMQTTASKAALLLIVWANNALSASQITKPSLLWTGSCGGLVQPRALAHTEEGDKSPSKFHCVRCCISICSPSIAFQIQIILLLASDLLLRESFSLCCWSTWLVQHAAGSSYLCAQ